MYVRIVRLASLAEEDQASTMVSTESNAEGGEVSDIVAARIKTLFFLLVFGQVFLLGKLGIDRLSCDVTKRIGTV